MDVNYLTEWLQENRMVINVGKSKQILFSKKRKKANFNLHINGEMIPRVEAVKYLGVVLMEDLGRGAHVDKIIRKLYKYKNI